jgi:hypothetical protein
MPRFAVCRGPLLAVVAAGLLGACHGRRATERLAVDTSLTEIPFAPLASAAPIAAPAVGVQSRPRAERPTAAHEGELDPAAAKTFILWARDGRGQAVSYRLNRSGEELERLDGIYIGSRAGTWKWHEEDVAVPTKACDQYAEDGAVVPGEPPPPGHATRVTLVSTLPSAHEQVVVDPLAGPAATDPDGEPGSRPTGAQRADAATDNDSDDTAVPRDAEDVRHGVTLAASVGPYLFLVESTYAYTCGAHGNTSVSARIWNVITGRGEPMPADVGAMGNVLARASQELTEEDDPFPATDENLELTAFVPRYGTKGALKLGLQLTAPTCYACTRGGYGSYTKSTVVDAAALPRIFSRYASAPAPIRSWIAAHPDERLSGYSGVNR